MYLQPLLLAAIPLLPVVLSTPNPIGPNPNAKRGLVYVPPKVNNVEKPIAADDEKWTQAGSPITWYYNYQIQPSTNLDGQPTNLEFVPMLWGDYENTFVDDVLALIKGGRKITHVLGFNEPNGDHATGGSAISPENAVARWQSSIQPLAAHGIKLGAPAPTGGADGIVWMQTFLDACDGCTIDFIPLHWYGNFADLASHMGQYSKFNKTLWITEFAFADQSVIDSQTFFNTSIEYFDRLDSVGRYTYFGSFRSSVSNVGKNAAMLDHKGGLTWLGAWYLNLNQNKAEVETGDSGAWRGMDLSLRAVVIGTLLSFLGIML